jgi:hypothetical protein
LSWSNSAIGNKGRQALGYFGGPQFWSLTIREQGLTTHTVQCPAAVCSTAVNVGCDERTRQELGSFQLSQDFSEWLQDISPSSQILPSARRQWYLSAGAEYLWIFLTCSIPSQPFITELLLALEPCGHITLPTQGQCHFLREHLFQR